MSGCEWPLADAPREPSYLQHPAKFLLEYRCTCQDCGLWIQFACPPEHYELALLDYGWVRYKEGVLCGTCELRRFAPDFADFTQVENPVGIFP